MQLGNILATAAEPVAYRILDFQVLTVLPDGKQGKVKARAALAFVSEAERQEAKQLAAGHCKPNEDLVEIEYYTFLMAAMRDADNAAIRFCPASDYAKFRAALVLEQVRWLLREYERFITDEYPETLTDAQRKALEEAARGNS